MPPRSVTCVVQCSLLVASRSPLCEAAGQMILQHFWTVIIRNRRKQGDSLFQCLLVCRHTSRKADLRQSIFGEPLAGFVYFVDASGLIKMMAQFGIRSGESGRPAQLPRLESAH